MATPACRAAWIEFGVLFASSGRTGAHVFSFVAGLDADVGVGNQFVNHAAFLGRQCGVSLKAVLVALTKPLAGTEQRK